MKNTYLKMTAVALTACVGLAATTQTALAQPAVVSGDFGTLSTGSGCFTQLTAAVTATDTAGSATGPVNGTRVKWFKFTLPVTVNAASANYLDIDSELSTAATDTEIALFTSTGTKVIEDDDDGSGALSQLTFGSTTARGTQGTSLTYNGRDGAVTAGDYYVAVGQFNTTWQASGFIAYTTGTSTSGVLSCRIRYGNQASYVGSVATNFSGSPVTFTDLGTLTSNGSFVTTPVTFDNTNQVQWLKFTLGTGVDAATRTYLDIDTEGSTLSTTQLATFSSTGARLILDTTDGTDALSQISYGFTGGRPAPGNGLAYNGRDGATLAAGTYWIAVAPATTTLNTTNWGGSFGSCTVVNNTAQVRVRTGTQPLPAPPTLQPGGDLGDIGACPTTFTGTLAAGEVKWYKFNLLTAVPAGGANFVDITTAGSALTANTFGPNDTFVALYNGATANVVASDDDDGPGLTSALSFGNTSAPRAADGDGVAYNGRDGALAAGTYYFAAAAYPVTYTADYGAVSTSAVTGTWVCRIRYGDTSITGGSAPATFVNMGTIALDDTTVTGSTSITAPSTVKWFKITIPAIAAASRQYLDLDTETSGLATASLGLYDSAGAIKGSDSGSGSGNFSKLSFGKGTRAAVGDGTAYAGGADLAAGDYYVAVSAGGSAYNASFNVTACAATIGAVKLNVRAGIQPVTFPSPVTDLGTLAAVTPCNSNSLTSTGQAIGPAGVVWYKAVLPAVSAATNSYVDIDCNGSAISGGTFTNDTLMAIYDNAGTGIAGNDEGGDGSLSALSFGATTPTRTSSATTFAGADGATLAAGTYWIGVIEYTSTADFFNTDFTVVADGAGSGTVSVKVTAGQFGSTVTGTPATFTDLGSLVADGNFATQSFTLAAQEVKWFKFTTAAVDSASRQYLDIDTEGSTGVTATALAVFDSTGAIKTTDLTDGTDSLSQISYGFTSGRAAPGNGLAYNGRDGATVAAGDYWVAVSSSTAGFSANWGNGNCGTASGAAKLNIRTGVAPPPVPPATVIDLGLVRSTPDPNNLGQFLLASKTTGAVTIDGVGSASPVTWVKFSTKKPTSASTFYVDIHTNGSNFTGTGSPNDTEIGVYNSLGVLVGSDDDCTGLATGSPLSCVTYGLTTPTRSAGTITGINGFEGAVLPAGTYYAAFGAFNLDFNVEFGAVRTSTTTIAGTATLTVESNLPPFCNDADVATTGSGVSGGPDGQNTVDDIIGFLSEFFANNLAIADLITLGGGLPAQPDGQVTVDDLIYFLGQFFAPCIP